MSNIITSSTDNKIAILITGSEFSLGLKQDSNSRLIADLLRPYGLKIQEIMLCSDERQKITTCLEHLCKNNSVVIVSGGLGPTQDDLTRFAISDLVKQSLVNNAIAYQKLSAIFAKRGRPMYESNKIQALFPEQASIINNPIGTADGFFIEHSNSLIISLPGVPRELELMLKETVILMLKSRLDLHKELNTKTIRLFGLPESKVGEMIADLKISEEVSVCYQAAFPEIQIILSSCNKTILESTFSLITQTIGQEKIFSNSLELSLEGAVHQTLLKQSKSLALAESCTGGMISALIVSNPMASKYYLGGINCYSNLAKQKILSVPQKIILEFDAVSPEVVEIMAKSVQTVLDSDYGLAITGYAGPDGSERDPAGTFYVSAFDQQNSYITKGFFVGERPLFQRFAAYYALLFLLNILRTQKNAQ